MNYLAHLFLSGDDEKIKVGNFLGDFVKGIPGDEYSAKMITGIYLHRSIDSFTDSHPVTQRSKKRLMDKYRHYSGVIIDIFYDHFLARKWEDFSDLSLKIYAAEHYELLNRYRDVFPEKAKFVLPYMKRYNWLYNYKEVDGIKRTLTGMSRRTKFDSKMEEASEDLKERYNEFEQDFDDFFPDIQVHCEKFLNG